MSKEKKVGEEERKFIMIDDEKHYIDEMDDNQKGMVVHIDDLNGRLDQIEYTKTQLTFGRQAFVNALKESYLVEVIDD